MDARPPERLWKYREWGDHARRMIVKGELYFSTVNQLNDPFEFRWRERLPSTPDEIDLYPASCVLTNFRTIQRRSGRHGF